MTDCWLLYTCSASIVFLFQYAKVKSNWETGHQPNTPNIKYRELRSEGKERHPTVPEKRPNSASIIHTIPIPALWTLGLVDLHMAWLIWLLTWVISLPIHENRCDISIRYNLNEYSFTEITLKLYFFLNWIKWHIKVWKLLCRGIIHLWRPRKN